MGNSCTGTAKQPLNSHIDEEPPDTGHFAGLKDLPLLDFEIELSNFKLIALKPYPTEQHLSAQIVVEGVLDVVLESKHLVDSIAKWKGNHRVRLTRNNYELRKTFLKVGVFNESRIKLGFLELNLYNLVVGPYHQDFPLRLSDGSSFRASLDVRVSQLVTLSIQPVQLGVDLVKEHPGEVFSYTLRTVNERGEEIQSGESYKTQTILYNKKVSSTETEAVTPTLKRRHSFKSKKSLVLESGKRLIWSNDEAKTVYNDQLPVIQTSINVSKIADYGFQLQLWRVQTETQDMEDSVNEEIVLHADAHINLNKIFVGVPTTVQVKGREYEKWQCTIVEKLWNEGRLLGSVTFKCEVLNPPFYRQMPMCMRTEKGIIPSHAVLARTHSKQTSCCEEIKALYELKQVIDEAVLRAGQKNNERRQWEQMKILRGIFEAIEKICTLLDKTTGERNTHIFSYRSTEELRKGQTILLDVGFKLLEFLVEEDASVADASWKALMSLISRDEFSLVHLGYTLGEETEPCFKQSTEVRLKYQSFLGQALKLSLSSLTKKALLDNERVFAVLFTAQAYLRLPEYRRVAIELFNHGTKDRELLEQIDFHSPSSSHCSLDENLKPLLGWEEALWQPLARHSSAFNDNLAHLTETLENPRLQEKLKKRGIAFFCVVTEFIDQVRSVTPFAQVNWESIPGYRELVRAVLCEMQERDIIQYPDSLKEASVKLLCNEDTLNVQIRLLFRKTNLYAPATVIKTLEMLDSYFAYFSQSVNPRLPICFDYKHLYAGLKVLLNSDHSFIITRTLSLIYHHYKLFGSSFRRDLSFCLMGQFFFKLFLNWSSNVRMMFHHILNYRVKADVTSSCEVVGSNTSLGKWGLTQITMTSSGLNEAQAEEVRIRLTTVMNMLQQANAQRKKNGRHIRLEKEYYRKMKSKLMNMRLFGSAAPAFTMCKSECMENISSQKSLLPIRRNSDSTPLKAIAINNCVLTPHNLLSPIDADLPYKKKNPIGLLLTEIVEVNDCKDKKKRRSSLCPDCEIKTEMTPYLEVALKEYHDIQSLTTPQPPILAIKIPMDQGDLRPDDIDEW